LSTTDDLNEVIANLRREIDALRGDLALMLARPSVQFRPELAIDGNQWVALYGASPQEGVAGFGDSPAEAMADFDRLWVQKLRFGVSR
jgi:hypothetical protein